MGLPTAAATRGRQRPPPHTYVGTEQSNGALLCPSPSLDESDPLLDSGNALLGADTREVSLLLTVSLNGQQFTRDALPFLTYASAPPLLHGLSVTFGPAAGGTVVHVAGLHLQHGTAYLCAFGAVRVNASYETASGCVTCVSPALASGLLQLAVSFNGHHLEPQTFPFDVHEEPILIAAHPSSGPAYGVQCTIVACPGPYCLATRLLVCVIARDCA